MNENEFIDKCCSLVDKLNKKYAKNVNITFYDDNDWFTYDSESNCINCSLKTLDDSEFQKLYDDYYIHAILHEYGHAFYHAQIWRYLKDYLHIDLKKDYVLKINNLIEDIIEKGVDIPNYLYLLNRSCGECFADYFVINIHDNYSNSNIYNFLEWRTKKIYETYKQIKNWKGNYFEYSDFNIYFPIPFIFNKIKLQKNLLFPNLFQLWINEYQKFLKMFYNQICEPNEKTNFLTQQENIYLDLKLILENFTEQKNEIKIKCVIQDI